MPPSICSGSTITAAGMSIPDDGSASIRSRKPIESNGPAGGLAGQLQRGLHRVRPSWTAELDLVVEPARGEHHLAQPGQEVTLGDGVQVQTMGEAVGGE